MITGPMPARKQPCPALFLGLVLFMIAAPLPASAGTEIAPSDGDTVALGNSTTVSAWPLIVIESNGNPEATKSSSPVQSAASASPPAGEQEIRIAYQAVGPSGANPSDNKDVTVPPAQTKPTTEEMFGHRGGYLHPFLGIREEFTDNLYNIKVDKVENLLTILSPGIWLSAPRLKEVPVSLAPHNAAVGGIRYSVPGSGTFERYQTYLLGALDYKSYSANSDLDHTAWRVEGMYQQNLPVGLSLRLMDRYTRDQDRFDMGSFLRQDFTVEPGSISVSSTPSRIRPYYSNQAIVSANLNAGEHFSALVNYINFYLDYDEAVNAWLDRTDNSLGLSLSYNYSPKTSFFLEYDHALLGYATDTENDSQNTFYYGGVSWQGSEKTSLMVKAGYQLKEYDAAESDDAGTFAMEAQLNYLITDKSKIGLNLSKALEETDSLLNRGKDTLAGRLRYEQRITSRIQGYVELWYELNDYEGFDRAGIDYLPVEARQDKRYLVRPGLQYFFKDWLVGELSYAFEDRNSNDAFYDFTSQSVFLSLNTAF